MELQPFGNPPGLRCRERFVQRRHAVSVQVVQDDPDHLDLRIGLVHQPSHLLGKVLHRAPLGHHHVPPAGLRLTGQEQVACALPPVLVVLPQRKSRPGRQSGPASGPNNWVEVSSKQTTGRRGS